MFLCDDCHGPKTCWGSLSRGACESCGKSAVCLDCPGHVATPDPDHKKEESE